MSEPIFHVALESDWLAGRVPGGYASSTRDKSLAEVGYVHAAYEHQVDTVIALHYADVDESLVLLVIDPARLHADVEEGPALTGELFPRIYGPINRDAVTEVRTLRATQARDDLQVGATQVRPEEESLVRDLAREAMVYVVIIAAVLVGGLVGTAVDDGAGTIVGIFAGLLVGVATVLLLGSRLKGVRP